MSNKRIEYIDMLKAFCIILVIAGHMGYTPAKVKLLLYIFHIPLFFFLSGMTLNVEKYDSIVQFFSKKFKAIVRHIYFYIFHLKDRYFIFYKSINFS